jgi:hypothetical protein
MLYGNEDAMDQQAGPPCAICGRSTAAHEKHIRFSLPDPVLNSTRKDLDSGTWLSHADAASSILMQVDHIGAFVRAALPVPLTGGQKLTFGVWVNINPLDLQRACSIWHEPEYAELKLTGYLANALEPWGLLRAPVDIAVVNPDHTPYCVSSTDADLSFLLHHEWPHRILDDVLGRYDRTGRDCGNPGGDCPVA